MDMFLFAFRSGSSDNLISVADPDPGSGDFLTGSGMEKNPYPGSGMNISDQIYERLKTIVGA
jgi:hypothetical protein